MILYNLKLTPINPSKLSTVLSAQQTTEFHVWLGFFPLNASDHQLHKWVLPREQRHVTVTITYMHTGLLATYCMLRLGVIRRHTYTIYAFVQRELFSMTQAAQRTTLLYINTIHWQVQVPRYRFSQARTGSMWLLVECTLERERERFKLGIDVFNLLQSNAFSHPYPPRVIFNVV